MIRHSESFGGTKTMKTVLICSRCGCGAIGEGIRGLPHDGPVWQWPMANKFGPACGGIIEARIITEGKKSGKAE